MKSDKKTTSTSPKKVQFDEYEVDRDQKDKKQKHHAAEPPLGRQVTTAAPRAQEESETVMRINELLQTLEDEIDKHYDAGQSDERDKALVEYCQTANEAAQNLNL